jgi:signal transduction histidine kinase
MYISGHDALYTVLLAAYGLLIGGWSAWLLGRRALRRLAVEERARRDLVAAVSHDLRTPITSLRLLAEAVDDDIVDTDTRHEYLARMTTHVHALSALIADLFELSRLEAGEIEWSVQQVPLDELVAETVEAMRPAADAKRVLVRASVDGQVGPARANPEKLQRVLFNLIQNAIRHTPADGSVTVAAQSNGQLVEVEVADTGAGVAPEERERVFEPFFRGGHGAARSGEGTGLGLTICRAIVEAHGGQIWLAESSTGTRVRFSLPRAG